jgi:hypothetical protein
MADIQITGEGRDPKGRRLFHCLCPDCGQPFSARADNVRKGKTKRCTACRGAAPKVEAPAPPMPAPAPPITKPVIPTQATEPTPEPRSAEWYRSEIASRAATLDTLMAQAGDLARLIESEGGVQPAGADSKSAAQLYRENVSTSAALRKEKRALETELYAIEGRKEKSLTPIQSVMARAAALRGKR